MIPSNKQPSIAVVHLIWIPFGINLFQSFIQSYRKYTSGYPHVLILLFNGVKSEEDTIPYHQYAKAQGIEYISYYRSNGFDLEAYAWLVPQIEVDYLLFLNSYCELMAENWLRKYLEVMEKEERVGMVGATATYESYYSSLLFDHPWQWNMKATFRENYRKYKLLIKTILLYRFYFKPFPNPHIRTNTFFISRDVWRSITLRVPKTKLQAYLIESGRRGLTRQLLSKNLQVLVMDKFGTYYPVSQWHKSQTFWIDDQKNLLVSDNQTRRFSKASRLEQQKLTFKAWGMHK